MDLTQRFLEAIMGLEGAGALAKATASTPGLRGLVFPAAAGQWVEKVDGWNGPLPGVPDSYLVLGKSEGGYQGLVSHGGYDIELDGSVREVVAAVACLLDPVAAGQLGESLQLAKALPVGTVDRLAKSIGTLVGVQLQKDQPLYQSKAPAHPPAWGEIVGDPALRTTPSLWEGRNGAHDYSSMVPPVLHNALPPHRLVVHQAPDPERPGTFTIMASLIPHDPVKDTSLGSRARAAGRWLSGGLVQSPASDNSAIATKTWRFAPDRRGNMNWAGGRWSAAADKPHSIPANSLHPSFASLREPLDGMLKDVMLHHLSSSALPRAPGTVADPSDSSWRKDETKPAATPGRYVTRKDLQKFDLPGKPAAPRAPLTATPPMAQGSQQATKPKKLKPLAADPTPGPQRGEAPVVKPMGKAEHRALKLTKAEMQATCPACGDREFDGSQFIGCSCLRDLAKFEDSKLIPLADGHFSFKPGVSWEPDDVLVLLGVLKRRG